MDACLCFVTMPGPEIFKHSAKLKRDKSNKHLKFIPKQYSYELIIYAYIKLPSKFSSNVLSTLLLTIAIKTSPSDYLK